MPRSETDHVLVAKVKGLEDKAFIVVTVDAGFGQITAISYPAVSEAEIYSTLHKQGIPDQQIQSLLEAARRHPV